MNLRIPVPAATADRVELADWIELEAIQSEDGASSFVELARQIRISGTTDAMEDDREEANPEDARGEQSEEVALDAWAEIERRHKACGGNDGSYPFSVTSAAIVLRETWERSPYVFQLLLTKFGYRAGPQGAYPERSFEKLSAVAAKNYLGGDHNSVHSYCFGFPRPDGTGFVAALNELCRLMSAGTVKASDPLITKEKDSHLDVVAWRPFRDRWSSQLILFGQCAVGDDWDRGKLTELQPRNFRDKWLDEGFYPEPVTTFFVPRCIEHREWRVASIAGGIIFDRCRIAELVGREVDDHESDRFEWITHVVKRLRSTT